MNVPPLLLSATVLVSLALAPASTAQSSEKSLLFEQMSSRVADRMQDLIELRHDIHRHPELSGAEERTAGIIKKRLTELGFEVRSGVGGYGVTGILKGGRPGPMVAFRADMDAVRSSAADPVAYRSLTPGVRHICGHDVHATIGIALAEGFAAIRDDLSGSVMLIFQPAEENGTGAKAMLRDGVFKTAQPDAIFALHTTPYKVGDIATTAGGMMAGRALIEVTIRGNGNLDAATAAVRSALAAEGSLSPQLASQVAPKGFVLVQLFPGAGAPSTGSGVVVRGQVMTAGPADRERAEAKVLASLAKLDLPGITLETAYDRRFMEGVTNDSTLVALANSGIEELTPELNIRSVGGAVPAFSEDFGSFQALVPGVMYFLGVSNPEAGTVGMPHRPDYVADDAAVLVGARAMLAAMLERLMGI